ncbi:MAG: methanol--corrinoid methyltransferase [Nitrososphaeria archaeon]|nr:methanol--corrinoid methyltransferase [Nitrososphaeria archaeon]
MKFSRLEYTPKDIVFGFSKKFLRYGIDLEVGNGLVVPEIKYFPRVEKNVMEEYKHITEQLLKRAVALGTESLQLETELTYLEMEDKKLVAELINLQKSMIERYAKEHGLHVGYRVTVADIRDFGKPRHDEESFNKMMEIFELASSNGADVLSIESEGGKELFNYSIIRQDLTGIVSSLGYLATFDMKRLWKNIVSIAKNKSILAGGDSACAFANTAMKIAGGLKDNMIPHSLASIVRVMSACRSLIAFEEGATGPGKDCAYENVYLKVITGCPMSMEGKSSAVAHSSLVGNIIAATCDLWSNEQVENIKLFGGYGPEVFLEILHYDTKLMNMAIAGGQQYCLRDLMIKSDKLLNPQAFVLSPDIVYEISKVIVGEKDELSRTVASAIKAIELMSNEEKLNLSKGEKRFIEMAKRKLEEIYSSPSQKVEKALEQYVGKVEKLRVKDYLEA